MSDRKRLYLMDGTQFAYRAYFAFIRNPLRNSKGINTSAPFGMLQSILKILESEKLDAFAVAFDKGKPVDRLEIYPEYKGLRVAVPIGLCHVELFVYGPPPVGGETIEPPAEHVQLTVSVGAGV